MSGRRKPMIFLGIGVVLLGAAAYLATIVRWQDDDESGFKKFLAGVEKRQLQIIRQSTGVTEDGKGVEYVVFLKEKDEMGKLKDLMLSQPDYRFIKEGFFGDSAVVAVNNGPTGLDYIRNQTWVSMVLRNRGQFACH